MDETNPLSHLPISEQRFQNALYADDSLGGVIRTATFIESYLESIIVRNLREADYIDFTRVTFDARLRLAQAMGEVDDDEAQLLRAISSLRNRYAHSPEMELEEADVSAVFSAMTGTVREMYIHQFDRPYKSEQKQSFKTRLQYMLSFTKWLMQQRSTVGRYPPPHPRSEALDNWVRERAYMPKPPARKGKRNTGNS